MGLFKIHFEGVTNEISFWTKKKLNLEVQQKKKLSSDNTFEGNKTVLKLKQNSFDKK